MAMAFQVSQACKEVCTPIDMRALMLCAGEEVFKAAAARKAGQPQAPAGQVPARAALGNRSYRQSSKVVSAALQSSGGDL